MPYKETPLYSETATLTEAAVLKAKLDALAKEHLNASQLLQELKAERDQLDKALHDSGRELLDLLHNIKIKEAEADIAGQDLAKAKASYTQRVNELEQRLREAQTEKDALSHEFELVSQRLVKTQLEYDQRVNEFEQRLHGAQAENDALIQKQEQFRTECKRLMDSTAERQRAREQAVINYHLARKRLTTLQASLSWQIGFATVQGLTRPGINTLAAPYRIIRSIVQAVQTRLKRSDPIIAEVRCNLPNQQTTRIPFTTNGPQSTASHKNQIYFAVAPEQSCYLSAKQNANFAQKPNVNYFHLKPATDYQFQGKIDVTGGQVTLWLIEYGARDRLERRNIRLQSGGFSIDFRTHAEHVYFCPALRLAHRGRIGIDSFIIQELTSVATIRLAAPVQTTDEAATNAVASQTPQTWRPSPPLSDTISRPYLRSLLGWPLANNTNNARLLSVLDEFSHDCFAPECTLITPRPDNWRELFEVESPQALLVESAWKGNGGSWQYRVGSYSPRPGNELYEMVAFLKHKGIPAIFWNKEDPVHYDKFIEAATCFEYIFTTDSGSVERYARQTQARSVKPLQFAAQPRIHNPLAVEPRNQRVCFAGSYYANRFEERRAEQLMLLEAATDFDLDIFDRLAGYTGPDADHFLFPEHLRPWVRGRLSYQNTVRAYKRYRVFLNVNSVVDSETMFSRRVFELLACGTPVVSTWSKAIENTFGQDLVWMVRSDSEAREALHTLFTDNNQWRRRRIHGLRAVFSAHTCAHRLQTVLNTVFPEKPAQPLHLAPQILFVAQVASRLEAQHVIQDFECQEVVHKHLLLITDHVTDVVSDTITLAAPADDIAALIDDTAKAVRAELISRLAADCVYGRFFALDLTHALSYSQADAAGKATDGADHYTFHPSLNMNGCLLRISALRSRRLDLTQFWNAPTSEQLHAAGIQCFAADGANFAECPGDVQSRKAIRNRVEL